ncbi:MAG: carboxypeptidase M32 [Truepera sp.]|nr:carboxypeptidase M32 [Truepera sp.]
MNHTLTELTERLAVISDLHEAASLLSWDQHTYMPPGATAARGQQLATLSKLSHQLFTDAEIGKLLTVLESAPLASDSDEAALVKVTRRLYDRASKLPADFVEEFAKLRTQAQQRWAEARRGKDFSQFAPLLQEIVAMTRREADYLGYLDHPYDALLDGYEPGMRTAEVKRVFAELKGPIVALVQAIKAQGRLSDAPLRQPFDEAKQEAFALEMAQAFGYDLSRGRLDRTVHPFAQSISKYDVRITTRYNPEYLVPALFGTLHETGHALYEQGVADEYYRSPLGSVQSLGLHESQSRLWENLVGRSRGFWQYAYPKLRAYFPGLNGVPLEEFYAAINRVEPSFIRVEADEVTYNLHIMLRFELELALLEGTLAVSDIPAAWNAKVEEYLGITPPDDALGCLQDIHWSMGGIGYFPTYTLGNVMSVQLFEAAKRAHPEIDLDITEGRFATLLAWLRDNVHRHGAKYQADELLQRATGSRLDPGPYIGYLTSKYRTLYRLA